MLYNVLNPEDLLDPNFQGPRLPGQVYGTPATQEAGDMTQAMPGFGMQSNPGFLGMDRNMLLALGMGLLSESGPGGNAGAGLAKGLQYMQQMGNQSFDQQMRMADLGFKYQNYLDGREDRKLDLEDRKAGRDLENKRFGLSEEEYKLKVRKQQAEEEAALAEQKRIDDLLNDNGGATAQSSSIAQPMTPGPMDMSAPGVVGQYDAFPTANSVAQQSATQSSANTGYGSLTPKEKKLAALMLAKKDYTGYNTLINQNKLKPKELLDQENKLRDDFTRDSKSFKEVNDAYRRIRASAQNPSAAGDLALIFNYMKMLDPGSTVREGEFANAQNAAGVPEVIRAQWNRIVSGERLSDVSREDFVSRANMLYDSQNQAQQVIEESYRGMATRGGLNPDNVVINYRVKEDNAPKQTEKSAQQWPVGKIMQYDPKTRKLS